MAAQAFSLGMFVHFQPEPERHTDRMLAKKYHVCPFQGPESDSI